MHQKGGAFAYAVVVASAIDKIKGERDGEEETRYIVRDCLCVSESERRREWRRGERGRK
jgi:hypothetical protein